MDGSDEHIQARTQERDLALAEIANALASMDQERRNPDRWERVCLMHAFAALMTGCYGIALSEA